MNRILARDYADVTRLKREYVSIIEALLMQNRCEPAQIEEYGKQGSISHVHNSPAHAGLFGCLLLVGFGKKIAAAHISVPDYNAGLVPKAIRELVAHCSPKAHYAAAGILDNNTSRMMLEQIETELAKNDAALHEVCHQKSFSATIIDPREGKLHVFKMRA